MFDPNNPGADYTLAWPGALFHAEAEALLRYNGADWTRRAELLLVEAFTGDGPLDDLREAGQAVFGGLPSSGWGDSDTQRAFIRQIVAAIDNLPEQAAPRPYWNERQSGDSAAPRPGLDVAREPQLQRDWGAIVDELRTSGYLERAAPAGCVDSPARQPFTAALSAITEERVGLRGMWPLQPGRWDTGDFYSMIEVVHDLVARPRSRSFHDYSGCGWHYSIFAVEPGQALYRWRINRLLRRYGYDLRLAEDGEDRGRLVRVANDERESLVASRLAQTAGPADSTIAHAVALFRGRDAGVDEKRSAIVALAGVLEQRRDLLRSELLSKDEGALFDIANNFDLRHRRADQRTDYDERFLDWLFWWYLATVDLVDRLGSR